MKVKVVLNDKVALEGEELEAHLEGERMQKEQEAAALIAKERSRRMLEADDLESDSDDSDDDEEGAGGPDDQGREDEPIPIGATGTGAGNPFMDTDDVRNTSFDIYVKGQQVRSTGFFKNAPLASQAGLARFRMFPFVERKGRRVDVYGEGIDVGAWVRKGREIEEDQESDEVKEAKRKQKEEEEKAVSQREIVDWIRLLKTNANVTSRRILRRNRQNPLRNTSRRISRSRLVARSSTSIWKVNRMDGPSRQSSRS